MPNTNVDNFASRSRTRRLQRRNTRALLGVSRDEVAKMDLVVRRGFTQHCVVGYEDVELPTGRVDEDGEPILREAKKQVLKKVTCVPGEPLPQEVLDDPGIDLRLLLKRAWITGDLPEKARPRDPLAEARRKRQAKASAVPLADIPDDEEEQEDANLAALKALSMNNSKAELQAGLEAGGIDYPSTASKTDLLALRDAAVGEVEEGGEE